MTYDVYDLYRQAQQRLSDREAAAAIPLLELASEQIPGDRAILRLLALAYYDAGVFAAAESTLRDLVRQDPLDADALHMLGQALERLGRTAEAGRYLSLAAGLDPAYSVACSVWGGGAPEGGEIVTLREITDANRDDILRLAVTPEQIDLVDSVALSLDEAGRKPDACPWFRAIYAGQTPVGFVMITDGVPAGNPEFSNPYYLWRLLIDAGQQRRGYGTAALELVVEYVRGRPGAVELVTSAVPGEGSPMPFYERFGFHPTGAMHDHEHVFVLPLG